MLRFQSGEEVLLNLPDNAPPGMLSFRGLIAAIIDRPPVYMTVPGSTIGYVAPHYFVSFRNVELPEVWPEPWLRGLQESRDLRLYLD